MRMTEFILEEFPIESFEFTIGIYAWRFTIEREIMLFTFILLICAAMFVGCRGYLPASLIVTPPALLPVKLAQPKEKFDPQMTGIPRLLGKQTFLSLDYSAGAGMNPDEYFNVVRANLMIASASGDPGEASRIGIGGVLLTGFYTGHNWEEPGYPLVERSVIAVGFYTDGCIDIAPGRGGFGVGWHALAALEGGSYAWVWNDHSNWPLPFIPQIGGYVFMNSELSDVIAVTLRGGMAIPGPIYFNTSFAWDRIMVGINGGYAPKEAPRYTGGISYRF